MARCSFTKRHLTLIWAIMECMFFTGIVFGWPWLAVTLRRDRYFIDICNITLDDDIPQLSPNTISQTDPLTEVETVRTHGNQIQSKLRRKCRPRKKGRTTTPPPTDPMYELYDTPSFPLNDSRYFCDGQEDRLEIMNAIVIIVRHALVLPLGIFLDAYGTTRTRVIAVFAFAIGTIVMMFSNASFPWVVIPAFGLISLAGLVILLTNLQVANLFGRRRYTVMATLVGAYHSSSIILLAMKESHSSHMETQTSFMFLTIGVVPILVSTIAFLPKSRIPWPLPAGYGKQGGWKESSGSRRSANGQGGIKTTGFTTFRIVACSSVYIWSVVWFAIYSLVSFTYDGNLRLMLLKFGVAKEKVYTYSELYASLLLAVSPVAPILVGCLLDWKHSTSDRSPPIQQMQNIQFTLVLTFFLALTSNILPTISSLQLQVVVGFALQTIERVAVITCLCAFLSHVHFPIKHFGKLIGLHFAVATVVSLLRFPLQTFIKESLQGDPFYVNLILLVLLLISCGHPINLWYHCRLGLIRDTSDLDRDRNSANEQHVAEEVGLASEDTP